MAEPITPVPIQPSSFLNELAMRTPSVESRCPGPGAAATIAGCQSQHRNGVSDKREVCPAAAQNRVAGEIDREVVVAKELRFSASFDRRPRRLVAGVREEERG